MTPCFRVPLEHVQLLWVGWRPEHLQVASIWSGQSEMEAGVVAAFKPAAAGSTSQAREAAATLAVSDTPPLIIALHAADGSGSELLSMQLSDSKGHESSAQQPQLQCCWAPSGSQLAVWGHLAHRAACCEVLILLGHSQQKLSVDASTSIAADPKTDAWHWSPCGRLLVHISNLISPSFANPRMDCGSVDTMFSAGTGQLKLKITMHGR